MYWFVVFFPFVYPIGIVQIANFNFQAAKLTVSTTTDGSDLVAMVLYDSGSDGVSIYDSKDILELIKSDIIWDYILNKVLCFRASLYQKPCRGQSKPLVHPFRGYI